MARYVEKRMCKNCGRDGTSRSMWFHFGGVYGSCMNVQACERRRIAGDKASDRREAAEERARQKKLKQDAENRVWARAAQAEYDEADEQLWGEAEPRDGIDAYAREVDPFFHG